ncbi:hypothetical protein [Agrobacterium pusense]|nr:hypothetical protein [Agrobacterium pusense]
MQAAKHDGELLEWPVVRMGGAVAIHEDRGVLARNKTGPQGGERID